MEGCEKHGVINRNKIKHKGIWLKKRKHQFSVFAMVVPPIFS